MKKFIAAILLLCFSANVAMADCDWTQIKKLPDGGFEYNPTLNLCVGNLVQTNKTQAKQIQDLTTAIDLKDAALLAADQRTQLWETTSLNEQDRLTKIDNESKTNEWIFFGLGVVTVIGSGFMAAKLLGK